MYDTPNKDTPHPTNRGSRSGHQRTRRPRNENAANEIKNDISETNSITQETPERKHPMTEETMPVEPALPKQSDSRPRPPRTRNLRRQLIEKHTDISVDVKPPKQSLEEDDVNLKSNTRPHTPKCVEIEIPGQTDPIDSKIYVSTSEAQLIDASKDNKNPVILVRNGSQIFCEYESRITYQVSCRKHNFSTKRSYELTLNGNVLMSAKSKGFPSNTVIFQKKNECHFSDSSFDYIMNYKTNFRYYTMHEKSEKSEAFLTINVTDVSEPIEYPRVFNVHFSDSQGTYELHSLLPTLKPNGSYVIQFGPTFIRESIKNMVLLDSDGTRRIMVRRISDDRLEIDALNYTKISEETLFGIGISAWICPL